jgi:hypothetical protein
MMMIEDKTAARHKFRLQQRLLVFSFCNLFLVALLGLLLRSFPFLSYLPFRYQNLLHGHSHFAFGGWIMPVLLAVVMKVFNELRNRIAYRHWRNIAVLMLVSAYGMLVDFPLQGYAPVSIAFSTLSIVATVYVTLQVWKASRQMEQTSAILFLKWGLLYACLSAIGPFATGPLIAMGKSGTPIYFNAIYFYLHFQYNGFFSFTVFAVLYQLLQNHGSVANGRKAFWLLNSACVPTYALSVLWSQPPVVVNTIGAIGACLQLAGVAYLLADVRKSLVMKAFPLLRLSLGALLVKFVLQLLSAAPTIALLAYHQRNFVIAYLHLVLLGFISLFVFAVALPKNNFSRFGVRAFLFSLVTTETLLVLNASSGFIHIELPFLPYLLFVFSLAFPVGVAGMLWSLRPGENVVHEKVERRAVAVS